MPEIAFSGHDADGGKFLQTNLGLWQSSTDTSPPNVKALVNIAYSGTAPPTHYTVRRLAHGRWHA